MDDQNVKMTNNKYRKYFYMISYKNLEILKHLNKTNYYS